ncbi:MAG: mannose-6-phosphate isomerase-like protein (cupin superfamily) [Bradymonadia bacterium]|jgi:mannose-6-phosphate isomerase-like protein (cupin superfamily)
MIERVVHAGVELAVIIRAAFREPGIHFVTNDEYSQQLAWMRHPPGHRIAPHVHNEVVRSITLTQEVLLIRRGKLRVDFYDDDRSYLHSRVVETGDTILLAAGGHGFEVIEEVEMIEVKQGPYSGEADKSRFDGISAERVVWETAGDE